MLKKMSRYARRIARKEDGSATMEFVFWVPLVLVLLGVTVNVSFIFAQEANLLRILHDANRAYSTNRITSATDTEQAIANVVQKIAPSATVQVSEPSTTGYVVSQISVPVSDLMPLKVLWVDKAFSGVDLDIRAQHYMEF